jgi:glutaredoxin
MIITCPKCGNNFLAPDDLNEGQKLKCGYCKYVWELKQQIDTIPDFINKNEHPKPTCNCNNTFPKKLLALILIFAILFTALSFVKPKGQGLKFKNVVVSQTNQGLLIQGKILNTTKNKINVPNIKINGKTYIKYNNKTLSENKELLFIIKLPKNETDKIKLSF